MTRNIDRPMPKAPGRPYVPVIRAGNWVYTSGFTGFDSEGRVPGRFAEQFELILAKAEQALQKAGATLQEVVYVHVYLTRQSDYEELNQLFSEAFASSPPARSCAVVKALTSDEKRVEMQFTAFLGEGPTSS